MLTVISPSHHIAVTQVNTTGTSTVKRLFVIINENHYSVEYDKLKSAEEEDPSVETLSVVVGDLQPPISRTSPEGSDQQRCSSLSSTRLTGSGVKVPLPSNFTQDR